MNLVKRLINLQPFGLGDVILEDEFFTQVTQKDVDFLNTFDADRLLYNFRLTAGLPNKAFSSYFGINTASAPIAAAETSRTAMNLSVDAFTDQTNINSSTFFC